jgi:hypothetical protein
MVGVNHKNEIVLEVMAGILVGLGSVPLKTKYAKKYWIWAHERRR